MISIAIGIGGVGAVYSVVDAALFRPPPLPGAERLVLLNMTRFRADEGMHFIGWSWTRFLQLAARTSVMESVATFSTAAVTLTGNDPEPLTAEIVSASYWRTLRISAASGRSFTPAEDDGVGAHPVAIVSYDLWRRRFGADPTLVGRTIGLNDQALTVVGVAPHGFGGLSGRAQIWIPVTMAPLLTYPGYLTTNQNFIGAIGRLRDGASAAQARAELSVLGPAIDRDAPSENPDGKSRYAATATPLADARIDPSTRGPMLLLLAGAGCLLLLASANVAGLLLGAGLGRRREIAIRMATGASRRHIVRQLLLESSLIACAGGLLGTLAVAPITSRLALPPSLATGRILFGALSTFAEPRVDARVIAFCVAISAATALGFGAFPALRASRIDLTRDLKEGSPAAGSTGRARDMVVALEAAFAVLLLLCGGALAGGWRRAATAGAGIDRGHLITFLIRPSDVTYPAPKAPALIARILNAIELTPGVDAATVDACTPLGSGCANSSLYIVGRPTTDGEAPTVRRHYVGPDQFRTLGVPLLRGRVFEDADRAGAPRVAIINASAAKRFWPNENPIGQRVWFGGGSSFDRPDSSADIVGIVGDVAYRPEDDNPLQADFYTPFAQFTYANRTVMVRTRGDPLAIVPRLREAVRAADPTLALIDVRTMADRMTDSWARLTYQATLLGVFAGAALLLAAIGIFATVSHAVTSRRREIGIRVALGATRGQTLATIAWRGAGPAIIGTCTGFGAAAAIGPLLRSLIYGVTAPGLSMAVAIAATMMLVIGLAASLAGRRALSIQPAEALRSRIS